jgi:hypothetical protein
MPWYSWLALGGLIGAAWVTIGFEVVERYRRRPRGRRPFDWHRDAPEYRYAKDRHVKIIP